MGPGWDPRIRRQLRWRRWLAVAAVVVGAVVALIAVADLMSARRFEQTASRTTGTVLKHHVDEFGDCYDIEVAFEVSTRSYRKKIEVWSCERYPVGGPVEVRYDPQDPRATAEVEGTDAWVGLIAAAGIGLLGSVPFAIARRRVRWLTQLVREQGNVRQLWAMTWLHGEKVWLSVFDGTADDEPPMASFRLLFAAEDDEQPRRFIADVRGPSPDRFVVRDGERVMWPAGRIRTSARWHARTRNERDEDRLVFEEISEDEAGIERPVLHHGDPGWAPAVRAGLSMLTPRRYRGTPQPVSSLVSARVGYLAAISGWIIPAIAGLLDGIRLHQPRVGMQIAASAVFGATLIVGAILRRLPLAGEHAAEVGHSYLARSWWRSAIAAVPIYFLVVAVFADRVDFAVLLICIAGYAISIARAAPTSADVAEAQARLHARGTAIDLFEELSKRPSRGDRDTGEPLEGRG